MYEDGHIEPDRSDPRDAYVARMVEAQLAQLERLRDIGMNIAGRLDLYTSGDLPKNEGAPFVTKRGVIAEFACLCRAIRQIIAMEQEILGLRAMPEGRAMRPLSPIPGLKSTWPSWPSWQGADRDDLAEPDDLYDYDDGPFDEVVVRICETLISLDKKPSPPSSALRARGPNGRFARSADSVSDHDATHPSHAHDPP